MGTHCFSICSNTTQPAPAKVTDTMTSLVSVDLGIYAFFYTRHVFSDYYIYKRKKCVEGNSNGQNAKSRLNTELSNLNVLRNVM